MPNTSSHSGVPHNKSVLAMKSRGRKVNDAMRGPHENPTGLGISGSGFSIYQ
jgi:hypothetical protein